MADNYNYGDGNYGDGVYSPSFAAMLPTLGNLPVVNRQEMCRVRFLGPFPLADVIAWLPPGPPLVRAIVSAQPLGAVPRPLPQRFRFIGPYRLEPLNPRFTPAPPPPPGLTMLGPLPKALPRAARFLRPVSLPDVSALLAAAPQPTIPEALLAAQRSGTAQPVITAVLRARRGSANRLSPTILYANALTDDPVAVALPVDGNIVRARLNGGNVQVNVMPGYVTFTTWTTITSCYTPPAGLGVALAAGGNTVALAFASDATHATVYYSNDDGGTWNSLGTVANTGTITDVAISYRTADARFTLITADNAGVIRAFTLVGGGGFSAATTLTPPSSEAINSVAIADFGSDWLVLFGWEDGSVDRIGQAIWGGGGLQAASTWSGVVDVLGVDPNSDNTPAVTGLAWGPDGGHAIIVENWAVLGGYSANNAYAMELSNSIAAVLGAYWTEPAPFPYTSGVSSTIFGPDLAYSQATAGLYIASAENLVAQLTVPADVDVSTRVIAIESLSQYHAGHTTIILDNSDGALTSLATNRETLGMRLDLALGYQTIDGPITLPQPQRWVVKAESSWVSGRHLVTLTCHDGWQLLHQLTMRRQAQFGTTLGLPALTVDQLIHWLCAKAGIDYTAAASTALNARTPNWTAMPGRSLGTLMLDLLDTIEGFLLMTGSGATVIPLSAGDPITYAFGGLGDHIVAQAFHTQELQTANLVSVYYGAHGEFILAQAFDPGDAHLIGVQAHEHSDTQLATGSDSGLSAATLGQDTANALLRKVQVSTPTHAIICIPQAGQTLGDVVSLVDPLTGAYYLGRVYSIALHYDRDKGTWQQTISLSGV
jgi:hypothetical protein